MNYYVLGFAFGKDDDLLLIRKSKPEWQAGRLNGVGGKIEAGEVPGVAMRREFYEETGVFIPSSSWRSFGLMTGIDWSVELFVTRSEQIYTAKFVTDEMPELIFDWHRLPDDVLRNLHWLVPLAADALEGGPVRTFVTYNVPQDECGSTQA